MVGNDNPEEVERFTIRLSDPVGAEINTAMVHVDITDSDIGEAWLEIGTGVEGEKLRADLVISPPYE